MRTEGIFTFNPGEKNEHKIRNTLVADGASYFLQTVFQKADVLPDTYYVGVTNSAYDFDTATLANMAAGEPVGNGYARQAVNRDDTDWTVNAINGIYRAQSKLLTFDASDDWDKTYTRAFLCDAADGTVGHVFAVSGAEPIPVQVLDGVGLKLQYEFRLRR